MNLRRVLILTAVALLALPLAACGNKEAETTFGATEGAYLNVGNLTYQVQISRQLNPNDNEDKGYLVSVPEDQRELGPDQAWFAVFLIAFNETDKTATTANTFTITDTEGNLYTPLTMGADNVFAWRGGTIPGGGQLPEKDTAASNNPSVNGSMLLFKVSNDAFNNRPLVLHIEGLGDVKGKPNKASVDLDV
jgi:hypothetical protein